MKSHGPVAVDSWSCERAAVRQPKSTRGGSPKHAAVPLPALWQPALNEAAAPPGLPLETRVGEVPVDREVPLQGVALTEGIEPMILGSRPNVLNMGTSCMWRRMDSYAPERLLALQDSFLDPCDRLSRKIAAGAATSTSR